MVRGTRLAAGFVVASWALACQELEPAPPRARPSVELSSPGSGQEIAFDRPFSVSGRAIAPEGAELERVIIVLSGAAAVERVAELDGRDTMFEAQLTVPGLGFLGSDRLPLDARVVVVARVDGELTESDAVRVPLLAVDRTAPSIEVELDPPGQTSGNFDAIYPANTPFTLTVRASDPLGGVTKIVVAAPAVLGGERMLERPAAHRAEMVVAFEPPQNADLELVVRAEDAAAMSNLSERTVRIRIGAGGTDQTPPVLTFVAPVEAECGGTLAVAVAATDDATGVERVSLIGEGLESTIFGPNPADPQSLVLNATVAVPRDRPLGTSLQFSATARDFAGNDAASRSYEPQIADTLPPLLVAVLGADLSVVPGSPYSAQLIGRESCSVIEEATATFDDGTETASAAVLLGAEVVDRRVAFEVPASLCTLDPIRTGISLVDRTGNASPEVVLTLPGTDVIPPRLAVAGNVRTAAPGETINFDVVFSDEQTPIATATVTLRGVGLDLPSPVQSIRETYPSASCADRGERAIETSFQVPADVRFAAEAGSVRIETIVRDAGGNVRSEQLDVAITDLLPPSLRLVAPAAGSVHLAGSTVALELFAADLNHDVDEVSLTVFGPASLDSVGAQSSTVAVQAASSTVSVPLLIAASVAAGERIRVVARARDTGALAADAVLVFELETCSAPGLSSLAPSEGPAGGDFEVLIQGSGFDPAITSFFLGTTALELVAATSSAATAHLPAGTYAGTVDLIAANDCGGTVVTATLSEAFTFVAPPVVELVRPRTGRTAEAGSELAVIVAAVATGSELSRIEARLEGQPASAGNLSGESGALDAVLLVPDDAEESVLLVAAAIDRFGQRSETALLIPVEAPGVRAVELELGRAVLAAGEINAYAVGLEDTGGQTHDATLFAAVSSSDPDVVDVDGAGGLLALSTGTATLTASFGGFQHTAVVRVFERGLAFVHGAVLVSSNPLSATFVPEVWLLDDGQARVVTASIAFAAPLPDAVLVASYQELTASVVLRARAAAEIAAGETWFVPSGQVFEGGVIAGRAVAWAADRTQPEWVLEIGAGSTLRIAAGGALEARGAFGFADGAGGRGDSGGGSGGASGANGEDSVAGGEGARALDGAAGAGGGSAGSGGRGGAASGDPRALGGSGAGLLAAFAGGGGGGYLGGGGGAGGGRVVIEAAGAVVVVEGRIDVRGGAGGSGIDGGSGGGGAGGSVSLRAGEVRGRGVINARGGAGGALGGGGARGSGGGGGGGGLLIQSTGAVSVYLDADVEGGATSPALGDASQGEPGARGVIQR